MLRKIAGRIPKINLGNIGKLHPRKLFHLLSQLERIRKINRQSKLICKSHMKPTDVVVEKETGGWHICTGSNNTGNCASCIPRVS